jgi:hypothetical protein
MRKVLTCLPQRVLPGFTREGVSPNLHALNGNNCKHEVLWMLPYFGPTVPVGGSTFGPALPTSVDPQIQLPARAVRVKGFQLMELSCAGAVSLLIPPAGNVVRQLLQITLRLKRTSPCKFLQDSVR